MTGLLDLTDAKEAHIEERLRENMIIWLGTVRPDGRPHLVAVWFLWDGETILIFSKPDQKIRNLKQNQHVALALDDTRLGAEPITLEGEADLLEHGAADASLPAYEAKYAEFMKRYGWTGASMTASYSEPIRVRPTKFFK